MQTKKKKKTNVKNYISWQLPHNLKSLLFDWKVQHYISKETKCKLHFEF